MADGGSSLLPLLLLALIVYAFIVVPWRRRREIRHADQRFGKQLTQLENEICLVTSHTIPGKKIKAVLGAVTGISSIPTYTDEHFNVAHKEAKVAMLLAAKRAGANAIIGVKMVTANYERSGDQWKVSRIVYEGTAVKLE